MANFYKSLFNFKASYASALTFQEGETFIELSGGKSDKNWYFVVASDGQSGFVPRNYMSLISELTSTEKNSHISEVLVSLQANLSISNKDRQDVGERLEEVKRELCDSSSEVQYLSLRSQGSKDSLCSIRSSKKRAAPQPPVRKPTERSNSEGSEQRSETSMSPRSSPRPSASSMDTTTTAETIPEDTTPSSSLSSSRQLPLAEAQKLVQQMSAMSQTSSITSNQEANNSAGDVVTVTYQHPPESCRPKALELVELVRDSTQNSHSACQTLLQSILSSLVASHKDLNILVPSLQVEFKRHLYDNESEIRSSHDFTDLVALFDQLTRMKEDDQQRNWMLYEDEATIVSSLTQVSTTLQSANKDISRHVLSRYKYAYVQNLVEYYQMETRWSIRRILIETFTVMCSLDNAIVSLMLSSVLPLEVTQDMFENEDDVERLKHSAVILTILFSLGEAPPIHYLEKQLGSSLVIFLINKIENPPDRDEEYEISDAFMGLLASYNLQFNKPEDNIVLKCLGQSVGAKIFTEKLLLLLNRDDDPAEIIGPRSGPISSIHKLVLDVFSSDDCISHFYTNDLMVLIDIIARQLADLSPGVERYTYLEMAHLVLARSGYDEHLHRLADLKTCLQRIQKEEGDTIDKSKVNEICTTFKCFQI